MARTARDARWIAPPRCDPGRARRGTRSLAGALWTTARTCSTKHCTASIQATPRWQPVPTAHTGSVHGPLPVQMTWVQAQPLQPVTTGELGLQTSPMPSWLVSS